MASEEHKYCANIIKNTHSSLRILSKQIGYDKAWLQHSQDDETLRDYAKNMKLLATSHWKSDITDGKCRIKWISNYCHDYFLSFIYKYRQNEENIAHKIGIEINYELLSKQNIIDVLDVGSCYNPLKCYSFMNVLPIDLYPADDSVFKCDFLNIGIGQTIQILDDKYINQLPENNYHAIIFSLLLEYLPSSTQRKQCCEKAYKLLKLEGILIIITPDSKHVGANAKIMKNWRYTLSLMGFSRICYEKLQFLHCMVFRKSIAFEIAERWSTLYKEDYMVNEINIPQDFNSSDCSQANNSFKDIKQDLDIMNTFQQLPQLLEMGN